MEPLPVTICIGKSRTPPERSPVDLETNLPNPRGSRAFFPEPLPERGRHESLDPPLSAASSYEEAIALCAAWNLRAACFSHPR